LPSVFGLTRIPHPVLVCLFKRNCAIEFRLGNTGPNLPDKAGILYNINFGHNSFPD
jgi:hypothetical protein